jgi:SAM-dependent methyltransferase
MGICEQLKVYEVLALGFKYPGLILCELGNQWIYEHGKPVRPAKVDYQAQGVQHTSIDINGRDGALKHNLERPVPSKLKGAFDVVTNYGTTEHINDQTAAFQNIDRLCRVGGVMIHVLPLAMKGNYPNHCRYHYTALFPVQLAELARYELIDSRLIAEGAYTYPKILLAFTLRKTGEGIRDFTRLRGIMDSGDRTFTGNYTSRSRELTRKVKKLTRILKGGEHTGP